MNLLGRSPLFRRLPSLRWRSQPTDIATGLVPTDYPALAEDLDLLERELLPDFRFLDDRAGYRENQFRLAQVVLITGGVIAAVLGAVQAVLAGQQWPGFAELVVAGCLSALAFWDHGIRPRDKYLSDRVAAEALRGEYFLYLGRVYPYVDPDPDVRQHELKTRVAVIRGTAEDT